jgi:hypothetical protein
MRFFSIVNDPRKISGCEHWIEKTVKAWRTIERYIGKDFLDTDDPLTVKFKPQITRNARPRTVSPDQIISTHAPVTSARFKTNDRTRVYPITSYVACTWRPFDPRIRTLLKIMIVELPHAPYTKFVMFALEL